MLKRLSLIIVLVCLSALGASAADVYMAQTAAGGATGANCANARTVSGTTWTAGNTYHLCGTITSAITPGASGTSGAHITILFETNAKISMTAIPNSGGINLDGKQYIDVDGGTNGKIESTANGTSSGRVDSHGVSVTGANLTVHGVNFSHLYDYVCCGSDNGGEGVYAAGNNLQNIRIYNNNFTAMFAGVELQTGSNGSNLEADHNTLPDSNVAWGIVIVQGFSNSSTTNQYIHDNDITPGSGTTPGSGNSWCTGGTDFNHLDPIHTWSQGNAGGIVGDYIYNNYIHGNFCVVGGTANSTAAIFWEAHVDGGSAPNKATVFNNLVVMSGGHPGDGAIYPQTGTDGDEYNNTVDCTGADSGSLGIEFGGGVNHFSNNIIKGCNTYVLYDGGSVTGDHNDYFGGSSWNHQTFAAWKSAHAGMDANSITTDPSFAGDHTLNSGSPAKSAGTNLTSLGITLLNTSKPLLVGQGNVGQVGNARPAAPTLWDLGAYSGVTTPTSGVSFSPSSLNFNSVNLLVTSPSQSVTITNNGTAILNISSISLTGTNAADFAQTNTCGPTLAIAAICTVSATFTPSVASARNAAISVADDAPGSPQTAALSGTGVNLGVPMPHRPVIMGSLPAGTVGTAYSGGLTITGDQPPIAWTENPTVPGLSFNGTTGVLSGTPTTAGSYPLTFQAVDSFLCGTDTTCSNTSALYPTTLKINPQPTTTSTFKLFSVPTSLSFSSTGTAPACQNLTIDDTTTLAPLPVTLSADQAWFTVTPATGQTKLAASVCVTDASASKSGHVIVTQKALNSSGQGVNNSPLSIPVNLTVAATTPPPPPVTVPPVVTPPHSVTLSWAASATTGITHYTVYRGSVSGGPYTQIAVPTALTFTDTTVLAGQTYFYVVTASTTVESAKSNQVSATIPNPQIITITCSLNVCTVGGLNVGQSVPVQVNPPNGPMATVSH